MNTGEKMPYPPSYTEIYPPVTAVEVPNNVQMGWQQPQPMSLISNDGANIPIVSQTTEPPPYGTQQQQPQQPQQLPASAVLRNRSRMGLYPIKLTPCPHCMRETKTTITYDTTLKTHLFALILCVMCCCLCAPLPYVTNNATKAANHFCESCKSYIGSYERNPCKW